MSLPSPATRARVSARYGSAADVARYLGLSLRSVRRAVADGTLPSYRVGRRRLVAFRDADAYLRAGGPRPHAADDAADADDADRARRDRAIALLDAWEADPDEHEQRETLAILRDAFGLGDAR